MTILLYEKIDKDLYPCLSIPTDRIVMLGKMMIIFPLFNYTSKEIVNAVESFNSKENTLKSLKILKYNSEKIEFEIKNNYFEIRY